MVQCTVQLNTYDLQVRVLKEWKRVRIHVGTSARVEVEEGEVRREAESMCVSEGESEGVGG